MRLRFLQPVNKAKPFKRTPRRLLALTNQMNKANQLSLLAGIRKFKNRLDPDKLYEAWKSGNYTKVIETIPWQGLHADLADTVLESHRSAFEGAAEFAIPRLPAPTKENLRFDTENSRIKNWLNTRTADLVMNIDGSSKESIRQAVTASFNRALTPRQVAGTVKGAVGLLPQHEKAVRKYADTLLAKGYTLENMYRLAGNYAERLLNYRAMNIARTETKFALNRGQLAIWQSGKDQGLISRNAKKVWVVDGRPCEICEPMDGVAVGLDEPWIITDAYGQRAVEIPTDSHPQCMCDMTLDFGDTEEEIEQNKPEEYDYEQETETE